MHLQLDKSMPALLRERTHAGLKRFLNALDSAALESTEYSRRHIRPLTILCICIPLAYVVDAKVGQPSFDTLWIRIIAFIVIVPLIFHDSEYLSNSPLLHYYFILCAAYVLPFTFGLMLVLNAAKAPPGTEIEMLWILQYFISLFLFIQLIHNGYLATGLWTISSLAALSPLLFLDDPNFKEISRVIVYPVTGYLTALLFGVLTNRNVDYISSEKLKAASAIGSYIAHELRTPLASIGAIARANEKNLSALCDGYIKAVEADLYPEIVPLRKAKDLSESLSLMQEEVEYSNTIINMLLLNTKERLSLAGSPERFLASSVIKDSTRRFPFNNSDERSGISVIIKKDFVIGAPRLLITHVLFNLIKNSVYYMQSTPSGRASIAASSFRGRNCIEVTDTGPGIPPKLRKKVFDRFFTTTEAGQGAGIGLSFCKMVMEGIGGEIVCESKEGEYTTFRLLFPEVR